MNIIFLGDIFGRPGRRLIRELLPGLIDRHMVDLVVANVENASGGLGVTIKAAEELLGHGIDVMTSGNHLFRHREIYDYLNNEPRMIRPANFPDPSPGRGAAMVNTAAGIHVGVVNVLGRIFMKPLDCPFRAADREIAGLKAKGVKIILVDFHAEATSEKRAMGWHLAGRVSVVTGTHTHVQTADESILPGGTAYITDAGMTGPHHSVIGMKQESVLDNFLTGRPVRFEVAKKGLRLEGVLVTCNPETGLSEKIVRIQEVM
jgi:2',3'-cyclic-nucleotide 2'-phosphodiesterase